MADLITIDRAKGQLHNAPTKDDAIIAALITAASGVIETRSNRTFKKADYDEIHSVVGPTASVWVNNPPIIDLAAVRSGEMPAVYVLCQDPTNQVQLATVDVTKTAVVLKRLFNGTPATDTFTFVTHPTFTDLATGINALGNGWIATVSQQFAKWTTADLTTNQGTRSARNVSLPLCVYWWYAAGYRANKVTGEIILPAVRGVQNYRIQYSGGFSDVPEEIQQACAELVQISYMTRYLNPLMQSETLDKYSYSRSVNLDFDLLSPVAKMAIQQFKIPRYTVQGVNARA